MNNQSMFRLQKKFRATFPEEAKLLDLAKTQDEIDELQTRFIDEAHQNMIKSMKESGASDENIIEITNTNFQNVPPLLLTNEQYGELKYAIDHTIETRLHVLMDGIQRLNSLKGKKDHGLFIASMVVTGIVAFGLSTIIPIISRISLGIIDAITSFMLMDSFAFSVVFSCITVIVFVVILPILHFTDKPANCIIAFINELEQPIYLGKTHNIHGHLKAATNELPAGTKDKDGNLLPTMGFLSSVKNKNSMYGTQFGFVLGLDATSRSEFSFAAENPLTSLYGGNNCYCGFDDSAKSAAKYTNQHNKKEYAVNNGKISLSIKCNSTHGSTAYYIARVYKNKK